LDLDVMTDLCSETTGSVILVVLEEHPLLTPEVEEFPPPPILIPKVLMKVRQENCLILLVAPLAPHQS
jgi:hypothetical protein